MEISPRLTRWINREFPKGSAEMVLAELRELPEEVIGGQDPERIQASLVIRTAGDWYKFQQWLTLAKSDWRDALVGAGLGDEDWPSHLDALLGTNESEQLSTALSGSCADMASTRLGAAFVGPDPARSQHYG